ncbi:superoxide dismutase family protein [Microbaculum marinum]|uniref:Superoxide dismutase [Cu-Zn] n=1 Tax=Microbaculum marinum TaxID=1764581 RepID=A0AAW9RYE3_9HYPH
MKPIHAAVPLFALAVSLGASGALAASANLTSADGKDLGTVELTGTPNGVILHATLAGLPAGTHGFHIHETGACTPDFKAAGDHFAGGAEKHGFNVEGGPHAGDMPNIHVPDSGELEFEVFNPLVSLDDGEGGLFDQDGTAIIIHSGGDDYESQPSGDAGDRIACAVIEQ